MENHVGLPEYDGLMLIAGNSNPGLAASVARELGIPLAKADVGRFPNGETRVEILESVRGKNVFVLQSTCPPANENLMELLLIMDALRRASAGTISAVIPFFGYAKQEKKKTGMEPISARLVADMMTVAGAQRIVTLDLHAPQIEGFFSIPVDNLSALSLISRYLAGKAIEELVVVAPDAGGVKRARNLANMLDARLAIIDKYRKHYREADAMNVVGKVKDMNAVIIDDFIDTGSSIVEAVRALKNHEARKIFVACTHPIHSDNATDRLRSAEIEELIVTDTIPLPDEKMFPKVKVLSVSKMLAEAIKNIYKGEPVSYLFHQYH
ncbi:ribose-phosphate pyrophosphokinase [Candidatus Woesearchaeota archaeon]|nr:ribose-phosphate pyrophosphokinase [Candidatus Woesearchaeota archaeon]